MTAHEFNLRTLLHLNEMEQEVCKTALVGTMKGKYPNIKNLYCIIPQFGKFQHPVNMQILKKFRNDCK